MKIQCQRFKNWMLGAGLLSASLGAGVAGAAPPLILVDVNLVAKQVSVQSVRDDAVSYFDTDGQFKSEPLNHFLRIQGLPLPKPVPPLEPVAAAPRPEEQEMPPGVIVGRVGGGRFVVRGNMGAVIMVNGQVVGGPNQPAKNPQPDPQANPPAATQPANVVQELALTDGQVLPGKFSGASDDGQSIKWTHATLGEITVSLDRVRSIRLSAPPAPGTPAVGSDNTSAPVNAGVASDQLVLVNGDRVAGFVTAIKPDQVTLQPQVNGRNQGPVVSVGIDRIKTITLAAPPKPDFTKNMVALHDGTRVLVSTFEIDADQFRLWPALIPRPAGTPLPAVALSDLERVDLVTGGQRLVNLTEIPPKVVSGGRVFDAPETPRVSEGAWLLHAPISADFALPDHVERFAMTAELDADLDDPASDWADMKGEVLVDGKSAAHFTITHASPRATINVPCTGLTLTVKLESGANGPVMDRLRLKDAAVMVKEK